jgi:hypothetical protein
LLLYHKKSVYDYGRSQKFRNINFLVKNLKIDNGNLLQNFSFKKWASYKTKNFKFKI